MQPLIAPLYGGRSAHEMLARLLGDGASRSGHDIVRDHLARRSSARDFDACWQTRCATASSRTRRRHRSATVGARTRRPRSRAPAVGAAADDARAHLRARPDGLGRPLRQQRLAAGAARAAHQADLGQRRADQPGAGRAGCGSATATWSSCASAQRALQRRSGSCRGTPTAR